MNEYTSTPIETTEKDGYTYVGIESPCTCGKYKIHHRLILKDGMLVGGEAANVPKSVTPEKL